VASVGAKGGIRFNPDSPLKDVPAGSQAGALEDWVDVAKNLAGGTTRLLLLHQADLVHGLPAPVRFKEALVQATNLFVVSFSPFLDETSVLADLILPDRVGFEDWGDDIPEPGPGYQVVGFQQPVVNPFYELDPRSFPDILLDMAQRLDLEADLPWSNFKQVLREGSDALFALNRGSIQASTTEEFWNTLLQRGGWWDEGATGPSSVPAPNGLLSRIASKAAEPRYSGAGQSDSTFYLTPFAHNSLLDGRNGHLPWLQGTPDPLTTITWQTWLEISDQDAKVLRVKEGDVVLVESSKGSVRVLVYPTPAVPPGTVSVPLGQGRRHGSEYASDRPAIESSNIMDVLEASSVDGTGALAWANTRVRLSKTGDSVKVSKLEGIVRAVEVGIRPGERIIHTYTPGEV